MRHHVARSRTQKVVFDLWIGGFHHDHVDVALLGKLDDLAVHSARSNNRFEFNPF